MFFRRKNIKEIDIILQNVRSFYVNEFFEFRKGLLKNFDKRLIDFNGAYILYNKKKDKYYVGQSIDVIERINKHFTGIGNGDIYSDYKNGDTFIIKYVLLSATSYNDLNRLEKDLITAYNAKKLGYNKTKGNGK